MVQRSHICVRIFVLLQAMRLLLICAFEKKKEENKLDQNKRDFVELDLTYFDFPAQKEWKLE